MNCVFCGQEAKPKTKEHVIPQWLIKATGEPNRKVSLGIDFATGEPREFAATSFTFPACGGCNTAWAAKEAEVKNIVERLEAGTLFATDATALLDWLDKVRVGGWLGFGRLNAGPWKVEPHYSIDARVRGSDRFAAIYRTDQGDQGLTLGAMSVPLFHVHPSAFLLRVNRLVIINGASPFFISRESGFPYPFGPDTSQDRTRLELRLKPGSDRPGDPFSKLAFPNSALRIGQIPTHDRGDLSRWQRRKSNSTERASLPLVTRSNQHPRFAAPTEVLAIPVLEGDVEFHYQMAASLTLAWQVVLSDDHLRLAGVPLTAAYKAAIEFNLRHANRIRREFEKAAAKATADGDEPQAA